MSKTYRHYDQDQMLLLPPSLREWLPDGHMALFISAIVDELDISKIQDCYEEETRGYPPYHPRMMLKVLIYGYCTGVRSSRKIAKKIEDDTGFRFLAGGNMPRFRAVAEFRSRHLKEFKGLFVQVLRMCQQAGLVKLGHVSLDGTKIRANASKHKAMSYGRMKQEEARLEQETDKLLKEAERIDAAEDRLHGKDKRGDELPQRLAHREKRLAKIREAKRALEEEAKAEKRKPGGPPGATGERERPPEPEAKAQRNFTDPESRIMLNADKAFVQAYNAQAVVDSDKQVIVGCDVGNNASDSVYLKDIVCFAEDDAQEGPHGDCPRRVSAG